MRVSTYITAAIMFVFASGFAIQAPALSCIQPNFATAFNQLNDVPEVYWVGYGTLKSTGRFMEVRTPNTNVAPNLDPNYPQPKPKIYEAVFNGGFLDGNTVVLSKHYTVQVKTSCIASWCGNVPESPEPSLFMMEQTPGGMVLNVGACPSGNIQNAPNPQQVEAVQACLRFGGCRQSEEQAFQARTY